MFSMEFSIENFVASPTVEELLTLRKSDLLLVVDHYKVTAVKSSMRKTEILNQTIRWLVDEEIFPPHALRSLSVSSGDESNVNVEVRLKELELEKARIELERERVSLQKARETGFDRNAAGVGAGHFDITKHVRMVPEFDESDVDRYFLHFEQVAESMEWPKEKWPHLLQTKLKGKACDAYAALSREEANTYATVKSAILNAYSLVPEAYRQKFRNARKQEAQSFREFAKNKEITFDRWLQSVNAQSFNDLRELMLLEEFKRSLNSEVRSHIEEQKVKTLSQAATIADEFTLTHRSANRFGNAAGKSSSFRKGINTSQNESKSNSTVESKQTESGQKTTSTDRQNVCYYCRQPGHVKSNCPTLQKKKQDKEKEKKSFPNGLVGCHAKAKNDVCEHVQNVVKSAEPDKIKSQYAPFTSVGYVSLVGCDEARKVSILRDTGASQSLILDSVLPFGGKSSTGTSVLLQGVEGGYFEVPLHSVDLQSGLVSGKVNLGIRKSLPMEGVSLILGNDLAGDKVTVPIVSATPLACEHAETESLVQEFPEVFPACAVTRSMARKSSESVRKTSSDDVSLEDSFFSHLNDENTCPTESNTCSKENDTNANTSTQEDKDAHGLCDETQIVDESELVLNKSSLIEAQKKDSQLIVLNDNALLEDEALKENVCFYKKDDVLMRKWKPVDASGDEDWREVHQIVVPKVFRNQIMSISHESALGGHLGVNKTVEKILKQFFWPGLRQDVSDYCRSCHVCQMVGKPNQKIPPAPLKPVPAFDEPFSTVIIDCVGPLPRTKAGHEYLLTMMCASTRFPEAVPLRRITAQNVSKALVKFFTMVGLPKVVQSDQGSNFTSKVFRQVMSELGIKCVNSSAYHPQSQGALERFHQTLKTMMKTYCFECEKDWDEGLPLLLFAVRESVQESFGFSPFELVFGHNVRGPLKVLREKLLSDDDESPGLLEYVSTFRGRLSRARELAADHLKSSQRNMKQLFDKKAKERSFDPGEKVLILLPIPGDPLHARYSGPYVVEKKMSDVNYLIRTPDRQKKKRLCHINMLKKYVDRNPSEVVTPVMCVVDNKVDQTTDDDIDVDKKCAGVKLKNSDVLCDLDKKLGHLSPDEKEDVEKVIGDFPELFSDVPGRTNLVEHDVDVGNAEPIKQHPYRASQDKMKHLQSEVEYMLENNIIEPSSSAWSSPCILVPKPNGSYRFCTDYRKVNSCTKTDSYPIPRVEDCIDHIGKARYVSTFDMLKGYWQIPLTQRAKEISAFVTPQGLFQYTVMPFGMKNAPATFQRMVNELISGLDGCDAYIDDVVIYSDTWDDHVKRIRQLFERLSAANLTVNLVKSEFGNAEVQFLGHVVGHGQVRPVNAKVEAVQSFPAPTTKKELMRFLGMAGYYRRFCHNFSDVVAPLTDLLRKNAKFLWSAECQSAFDRVKAILSSGPVLAAPDFSKGFSLAVDASDIGAGAVLMQMDEDGVDKPVSYFSKKFSGSQRNYSTIEKETLALILALQHFEVYVGSVTKPVVVWTDHNPLTFISRMKNKNQRLMRWSIILQEYILDIRHIRGKDNLVADTLSRVQ